MGCIGLVQARRARSEAAASNAIALEANDISRGANDLSKKSNEIALLNAKRDSEIHDVDWDTGWREVGLFRMTNVGPDDAHGVHFQVSVDGHREEARQELVRRNEDVFLAFEYLKPIVAQARMDRVISTLGFQPNYHSIKVRVTWQTDLGSPRKYEKEHRLASLEPEDRST